MVYHVCMKDEGAITKAALEKLYLNGGMSISATAKKLKCSPNKVYYWLLKHDIKRRSRSEGVYRIHNPKGDPFKESELDSKRKLFLFGIGIGLYWGEGTKKSRHSVRLGNSDPRLVKAFILFLQEIYCVKRSALRFGLQVFDSMNQDKEVSFWAEQLKVSENQFYKTMVTPSRGKGTYRNKMAHGVITVYFNNYKLRDIICESIENFDGVLSQF